MLQQLNYLDYLDMDHIRMFHVKDAEFNPTGRGHPMAAINPGSTAPGRSLGDGQVDFKSIFSKLYGSTAIKAGPRWSGNAA